LAPDASGALWEAGQADPPGAAVSQETPGEKTCARMNFLNKFKKFGFIECNGDLPLKINSPLLSVVLHD
jgi:hypothetical protein